MCLRKIILLSAAIISAFGLSSCAKNTSGTFVITDYGAVGDAKTLNTASINKALSACAKSGGGTVMVPPGTFRTGPIRMYANTTLHLEAGAVLKGSADLNDYIINGKDTASYRPQTRTTSQSQAGATIDGSGLNLWI